MEQHSNREPRAPVVVPIDQRGVSVNVACQHALNVGGIVAHVLFYNPPLRTDGHIARAGTSRKTPGIVGKIERW